MTRDCHDELGSQFLWHRDLCKFLTVKLVWFIFFIIPVIFLFCFWTRNYIYCVQALLQHVLKWQSKRKSLQNSESPFSFHFGDIGFCSRYNFVNYGTWHVFKPLFGSSVATCRPAQCSKIWFPINKKNLKRSPGNGRTLYKLADGETTYSSTPWCVIW